MKIRAGNIHDLNAVAQLGESTWSQFKTELTTDNWQRLANTISNKNLYKQLLQTTQSLVCENEAGEIIGMSFLVASGNPTEIYNAQQCYIRFVTVASNYQGKKLGQKLTERCIELARQNGEQKIALHTSEFMPKARHIYEKLGFSVSKEIAPRFGKKYWLYEMNL